MVTKLMAELKSVFGLKIILCTGPSLVSLPDKSRRRCIPDPDILVSQQHEDDIVKDMFLNGQMLEHMDSTATIKTTHVGLVYMYSALHITVPVKKHSR